MTEEPEAEQDKRDALLAALPPMVDRMLVKQNGETVMADEKHLLNNWFGELIADLYVVETHGDLPDISRLAIHGVRKRVAEKAAWVSEHLEMAALDELVTKDSRG